MTSLEVESVNGTQRIRTHLNDEARTPVDKKRSLDGKVSQAGTTLFIKDILTDKRHTFIVPIFQMALI